MSRDITPPKQQWAEHFKQIENNYPSAPHYPLADGQVKVPAGWLIERCGWKGKRIGDAGTYHKQALVIVNHGNATGQEIWDLAQQIIEDVEKEFSIRLQAEVNVIWGRLGGVKVYRCKGVKGIQA